VCPEAGATDLYGLPLRSDEIVAPVRFILRREQVGWFELDDEEPADPDEQGD